MGRKRIKQYLMLLLAIGVIAVVVSGSGTFASFNAETQNNGNTFATGTLLLHNTANGGTTCASESTSSNTNLSSNNCTVLFSNVSIGSPASGTLHTSLTATPTTTIVADLTGSFDIEPGDLIKLDDGTHNDTFTAAAQVVPGSSVSIPILSQTPSFAYSNSNTNISVLTYTTYATLALKNAGTLNAQDIKFAFPSPGCSNTASSTLSLGTTNATYTNGDPTISLGTPSPNGAPSGATITIGTDTLTLTQQVNPGDATLHVSGTVTGGPYSSGTAISYAPFVSGGGTLCSNLKYAIVETNSSFQHDNTVNAQKCSHGDTSTSGVSVIGCDFAGSAPALGTPTALTGLDISDAVTGSAANRLDAGGTRYFVIGVQMNVSGVTNSAQNQQASFAMQWHIDQQ